MFLIISVAGLVLVALLSIFNLIPIPDFLLNVDTITLPASIAFFAEPFHIDYALGIYTSAYTVRFIIRRLPIIG